ncbi:MAG: hypothetical protein R3B49_06435 [Phycisphaerales bacterium]
MDPDTAHPYDAQVITDDRECPNCGYNLRGLKRGGKCPECGRAIGGRRKGRLLDNIVHAPPSYLRTLRLGLVLMSLGVLTSLLPIVPAVLWACGVWIAMTKRPLTSTTYPDAILDSHPLRTVIRISQVIPIAGTGLVLLGSVAPAGWGQNVLWILGGVAMLVGAAGFVPLGVYLSALADWASHDALAGRLKATTWTIAFFGILGACTLAIPVFWFLGIVILIVLIIAFVAMVLWVLMLTNVVHWAIRNQSYAEGSAARVAEKIAKRHAEPNKVHDLSCARCGYDLEGLPLGGTCPECGESYADATSIPIREVPKRRPADEAPIPLSDDETPGSKSIRHSRGLGEPDPDPTPRPAPPGPDEFPEIIPIDED